ncbi:YitT family protein [Alicyclobacillus cycloheptanicus]|uniref:Uncharacterized membrane-anchored protein YitT (DUF2179 family) n=1 Tax=Alicyclobacillus cycloheptanicus TaxID=1457 RepID=A0ABT9XMG8_9BACL|nr:YitT family protein [Alicyclobacillus cycloheptanicus]MDQ0191417.1 uncharacterized membrane-anchored protein YitT (DUF2179 family) [Alicyclobacillus cycloheptanicus]WDM02131.1 YitT family protein [Alicyclobacillus cycloheptanicus]
MRVKMPGKSRFPNGAFSLARQAGRTTASTRAGASRYASPLGRITSGPGGREIRFLFDLAAITFSAFLIAFGVKEFLVPAKLLTTGLFGICIILYKLLELPIGMQFLLYNIPLLILGFRSFGKRFMVYTVISVIEQSVFTNVLHVPRAFTNDPILAAIFGGFIIGFGSGLTLRVGGSAGGFDILARFLARRRIPMGTTTLVINCGVILAAMALFDVELALYTLMSIFVTAKTYDAVLNNMDKVSLMIVTTDAAQMQRALMEELGTKMEMTLWDAGGTSPARPRQVLYCIAVKEQVPQLKAVIQAVDPLSVCTIVPASDVIGGNLRGW